MTDFTNDDRRALLAIVERIERDVSEGRLDLADVPQLLANLEMEFSVRGYLKGAATDCFWSRMKGRALGAASALLATPATPAPKLKRLLHVDYSKMFGRVFGHDEFSPPQWGDIW